MNKKFLHLNKLKNMLWKFTLFTFGVSEDFFHQIVFKFSQTFPVWSIEFLWIWQVNFVKFNLQLIMLKISFFKIFIKIILWKLKLNLNFLQHLFKLKCKLNFSCNVEFAIIKRLIHKWQARCSSRDRIKVILTKLN